MDEVAHEGAQAGHDSRSNCLMSASASVGGDIISDPLNNTDNPDRPSISSRRQLSPVIYTKHHFEVLGLGIRQYTLDMLRKHEERGVVIGRRDVERYWRRQVRQEYSQSHPLRTTLCDQAGSLVFLG